MQDEVCSDLAKALFATGLRISEALALIPSDLSGFELSVTKQLTRDGELRLPKRDKTGRVAILAEYKPAIERWIAVEDKQAYRFKLFEELMDACQQAFPKSKERWIGVHDLRHSHAIHLLKKGATLTLVAMNLRNRLDVCQKYYTGFAHNEGTVDLLKKLINS